MRLEKIRHQFVVELLVKQVLRQESASVQRCADTLHVARQRERVVSAHEQLQVEYGGCNTMTVDNIGDLGPAEEQVLATWLRGQLREEAGGDELRSTCNVSDVEDESTTFATHRITVTRR